MKQLLKNKKIIASIVASCALLSVGVFALNGYFGGGADQGVPDDTWTRGLVASYDFDEGSGQVAYNAAATGQVNDGTLGSGVGVDSADPKWVSGGGSPTSNSSGSLTSSGALQFDGTDDYINCGNDSSLDITDAITVEAWVKKDDTTKKHILGNFNTAGNEAQYNMMYYTGGYLRFRSMDVVGGTVSVIGTSQTIATGAWVHVVVTRASADGTVILYVNGVADDTTGTSASSKIGAFADCGNIAIGGAGDYTGDSFNGSIDGVKIYNRALSAEEVRYHYNRGGPVAHWKFDEGSGESAEDSSGNNNDGILKSSALDFDGVNDYVDTGNTFQSTFRDSFTTEMWVKPTDGQPAALEIIYGSVDSAVQDFLQFYIITNGKIQCDYSSNHKLARAETASVVFSNGQQDWTHIVMFIDKTVGSYGQMYIYVNGVLQTLDGTDDGDLDTSSVVMGDWTSVDELFIGARDNNGSSDLWFDGSIDEVRIYNAALTAEEIVRHYNGDFSQDPTDNLVMLHHFEEGTACDTCADPGGVDADCLTDDSGNGNDGTLYNFDDLPNYDAGVDGWVTTVKKPSLRWTAGKHKSAGNFDGGGDRVYQAYDSAFDFGTKSFTISSWFKHNTIAISSDYLLSRYDDDQGYKVWMDDSGDMCFGIDDDATWNPDDSACTDGIDYDDNQWHHLTAYKDGTSAIYLYIDSVLVASKVGLTATGTLTSNSATMNIGSDIGVGSVAPQDSYYINTWEGEIDDMKVYAYGRSADEIRLDYNAGFAARFGGLAMSDISNCSLDPAACMDHGLVGHWNMDEAGGDTLYDQSDNGNDGTLGSGAGADTADPKWTSGGGSPTSNSSGSLTSSGALQFDGTDDYVNCGNDSSLNITDAITIEAWVKLDDKTSFQDILTKGASFAGNGSNGAYALGIYNNRLYWDVDDGTTRSNKYVSITSLSSGWHHIVGIFDGTNQDIYIDTVKDANTSEISSMKSQPAVDVDIGGNNFYFNGSIDGVKIYNRALSAEEVRYHYNRGGPVAHWKFDEGSGQYARDSIGTAHAQLGVNASSAGDSNDPTWSR